VPTPPQSPPDFTPSPASTNESCSPQQQFPNPTGEQLNGLEGRGVEKGSASSLAPPVTRFVQVLKSGEVVYSQLPQQQSGGESKVEPSLMGMATPVKFPPTFTSHEAIKQEPPAMCIGQKRPHPDSGAGIDSSKLTRKQQRMMKNRESASISRQKKKEYVQSLEARLSEAAMKNAALLRENNVLRNQVSLLEKEEWFYMLGPGKLLLTEQ